MSSLAGDGRMYSSEDIVRDPDEYMRSARRLREEQAREYVSDEIDRRTQTHPPTKADNVARYLTYLAMLGAGVSLAVVVIGLIVTR